MKIQVRLIASSTAIGPLYLRTDHPSVSYNQPVLYRQLTGEVFGYGDSIIGAPMLVVPWQAPEEDIVAIRAWNRAVAMVHQKKI